MSLHGLSIFRAIFLKKLWPVHGSCTSAVLSEQILPTGGSFCILDPFLEYFSIIFFSRWWSLHFSRIFLELFDHFFVKDCSGGIVVAFCSTSRFFWWGIVVVSFYISFRDFWAILVVAFCINFRVFWACVVVAIFGVLRSFFLKNRTLCISVAFS